MSGLFVLVLVVALGVWLAAPGRRRRRAAEREPVEEAELEAAEREVRDLGVDQRPEDGWEGDDWGPGAGGRRPV
jgi:hypothetical protein